MKNKLNTLRATFSISGSTKPLHVALKTRTKDKFVLSFKRPQFNLREIVQYQAQCKGPGNEVAIGYTISGAELEVSVGFLAPNRKYICEVSSSLRINHLFFVFLLLLYFSNNSQHS